MPPDSPGVAAHVSDPVWLVAATLHVDTRRRNDRDSHTRRALQGIASDWSRTPVSPSVDTGPDHDTRIHLDPVSVRQHPSTPSRLHSGGSAGRDPVSGLARRHDHVDVPPGKRKSTSSSRRTVLTGGDLRGTTGSGPTELRTTSSTPTSRTT